MAQLLQPDSQTHEQTSAGDFTGSCTENPASEACYSQRKLDMKRKPGHTYSWLFPCTCRKLPPLTAQVGVVVNVVGCIATAPLQRYWPREVVVLQLRLLQVWKVSKVLRQGALKEVVVHQEPLQFA